MATLKTITKHWASLSPEARAQNARQAEYIRELAARTGVNITRWGMKRFCEEGDYTRLFTDRNAINRVFFATVQAGDGAEGEEEGVSDEVRESIRTFLTSKLKSDAEALDTRIQGQVHSLEGLARRIQEVQATLSELSRQKAALESPHEHPWVSTAADQLEGVLAGGWYTDLMVREGKLEVLTGECFMSERSRAAGLDVTRNFGVMAVQFVFGQSSPDVYVYPYKGNIQSSNSWGNGVLYHPHVSPDARVCWGDAMTLVHQHLGKFEFGSVLSLLHGALTTYNAGNPYAPLDTFEATYRGGIRDRGLHYARDREEREEKQRRRQRPDAGTLLSVLGGVA